jgi:hypothetical protein
MLAGAALLFSAAGSGLVLANVSPSASPTWSPLSVEVGCPDGNNSATFTFTGGPSSDLQFEFSGDAGFSIVYSDPSYLLDPSTFEFHGEYSVSGFSDGLWVRYTGNHDVVGHSANATGCPAPSPTPVPSASPTPVPSASPTPVPSASPATLTFLKEVDNSAGGTAVPGDFLMHLTSNADSSFAYAGYNGDFFSVVPGTYTLTEDQLPGYTSIYGGGCFTDATNSGPVVTISAGESWTCGFTNTFVGESPSPSPSTTPSPAPSASPSPSAPVWSPLSIVPECPNGGGGVPATTTGGPAPDLHIEFSADAAFTTPVGPFSLDPGTFQLSGLFFGFPDGIWVRYVNNPAVSAFGPNATGCPTPAPTATPTPLPTASPTPTPLPTASPTPTPLPTASPTPTPVVTPTPLPTASPSPTPTPVVTPTPTPVVTPTPTPSASPTPSATPVASHTPAPSHKASPPPTTTLDGGAGSNNNSSLALFLLGAAMLLFATTSILRRRAFHQ